MFKRLVVTSVSCSVLIAVSCFKNQSPLAELSDTGTAMAAKEFGEVEMVKQCDSGRVIKLTKTAVIRGNRDPQIPMLRFEGASITDHLTIEFGPDTLRKKNFLSYIQTHAGISSGKANAFDELSGNIEVCVNDAENIFVKSGKEKSEYLAQAGNVRILVK